MISCKRTCFVICLVTILVSHYDGSGIPDVGNIQVSAISHDTDARRATEAYICAHVADLVVGLFEALE